MMENWGRDPHIVSQYARHYESNNVIPTELLEKISAAVNFNLGFITTEYLAASYLDLAWHMQEGKVKVC